MSDLDTANKTQKSLFQSIREELTPQKLWKKTLYGDIVKELTFKTAFTSFFSTLFLAFTLPYQWYFMGALIGVDAYTIARNSAEAVIRKYVGNGFFSQFILQPLSEVFFAAAALTVVIGGLVLGSAVLTAAVPFVFMGIMGIRAFQHFRFGEQEKAKYLEISKYRKSSEWRIYDSYNQGTTNDNERKEKIISYLVDKDLAEAYFELKNILNPTPEDDSTQNEEEALIINKDTLLNNLKNVQLKEKIVSSLNLISEKVTLGDALKQLQSKISQDCLKQYGHSPLTQKGNFNDNFLTNTAFVENALKKAETTRWRSMMGHRVMGGFLLGVGFVIAAALGPLEAILAKFKIPLVIGATAGLAVSTVWSGIKLYNASKKDKNIELTASNSGADLESEETHRNTLALTKARSNSVDNEGDLDSGYSTDNPMGVVRERGANSEQRARTSFSEHITAGNGIHSPATFRADEQAAATSQVFPSDESDKKRPDFCTIM
jgi:hypothetical protein